MGLKRAICLALTIALTASASATVAADDLFDGSGKENAELAKEYLSEVIDYINNNYIGGDVSTQQLVEAAINGMAHSLDDYSEYYTQDEYDHVIKTISGTVYSPGIDFEISSDGYPHVTKLQSGSAAGDSGIRLDDTILEVNDVSTYGKGVKDIENMLTRSSRETLRIKILHHRKESTVSVSLKPVQIQTVEVKPVSDLITVNSQYDNSKLGYIKISQIADNTASDLRQAISSLRRDGKTKLILDLRGNTGGYVEQAIEICRQLVPAGRIIYTKDKSGNVTEYNSYLTAQPFESVAVLVDGMTASASEIVASAIQDSGAGIIIGQKTYGKGVMQSVVDLSEMGYLKLTAYEYFTRTGKKVNGVGVIPDIEIGDVLFVSSEDGYSSSKLRTALELLGYNTLTDNKVKRSLGSFQRKEGLPVTYKLDTATVSALNVKIYTLMNDTDRTMLAAYVNLMGESVGEK
jgi:carboxyl-terminal processing protease